LKGIAIGLSNNSKEILKRLKKTEFVKDIYIAGSSKDDGADIEDLQVIKPREILVKKWPEIDLIIFIGSIGASIRIINSFLTSKDQDPGVIVIDNKCSKIIPLIGLHQSNTQNIAFQIANLLGGEIIETNNSNDQSFLNLDAFGNQWGWKRSGNIKDWSKLVIKQAKNEEIFCKQLSGNRLWKTSESGEIITQINEKDTEKKDSTFHVSIFKNHETTWHPPVLWIGIGCERNTSKELIANSLKNFLKSKNLSHDSIAGFATVDIKKDEKGILELADENNLPIKFFNKEDLSKIIVPNPSNIVQKEIGTPSVAEASCLLAAGEESKLLEEKRIFKGKDFPKIKFGAVTIAIAESKNQYYPTNGEIHIIGSGPGDISFLTNNARKALSRCSVWIGYKMYLELIKNQNINSKTSQNLKHDKKTFRNNTTPPIKSPSKPPIQLIAKPKNINNNVKSNESSQNISSAEGKRQISNKTDQNSNKSKTKNINNRISPPELVGAPIRRDETNQQNNKQNISFKQTFPNRSGTPNRPGMPNRPGLRNKPSDQGRPGSFNRQANTSRSGAPNRPGMTNRPGSKFNDQKKPGIRKPVSPNELLQLQKTNKSENNKKVNNEKQNSEATKQKPKAPNNRPNAAPNSKKPPHRTFSNNSKKPGKTDWDDSAKLEALRSKNTQKQRQKVHIIGENDDSLTSETSGYSGEKISILSASLARPKKEKSDETKTQKSIKQFKKKKKETTRQRQKRRAMELRLPKTPTKLGLK